MDSRERLMAPRGMSSAMMMKRMPAQRTSPAAATTPGPQPLRDDAVKIASAIMVDYQKIKDECGEILDNLFHEQLSTREAVSTTILVRSLKRINSHMCNIASGIVYPLDKIDFVRVRDGLLE